ncbi:HD-GYP domain-containing protein [Thermomonas alba]|uniref:HD-GYP domain-containing protein n=1 Tax=Thermomonas alba TaxID=2888525 RepID=UPI0023D91531|nr:HD-GYP domain-containing protein [Thermomonas alba]
MSPTILQIPVSRLRVGMYLHKLGGSWLDHPFLRNSFLLEDPKDLQRIIASGIQSVWIDTARGLGLDGPEASAPSPAADDEPDGRANASTTAGLTEAEREEIAQDRMPERFRQPMQSAGPVALHAEIERAREICLSGKQQVMALFGELRLGNSIEPESVLPLVEEMQASVLRNPSALISVARLKTHDDYTYLHSVAVAALMLALARQLGLDPVQTKMAGCGGLMHDLGKAFMPLEILNKPGRLTDEEFAVMKTHPAAGARALQEAGAEAGVIDIALHHHERMDGRGYPHGLRGEEISLLARMGAICDVYDAVTSVRAYKAPWDPAGAMREMARWEGHFDKRIFNAFVKTVGIYPIGALVRLASEHLAVVAEQSSESLLKPKVRVFYSLRRKEKVLVHTLDLADPACQDSIVGPENPEKWGFTNLEALWL